MWIALQYCTVWGFLSTIKSPRVHSRFCPLVESQGNLSPKVRFPRELDGVRTSNTMTLSPLSHALHVDHLSDTIVESKIMTYQVIDRNPIILLRTVP